MNKFVCPRCGLVNLEKFVTFPHCAACGARLPAATAPSRFWRRPVRAPLWASIIGLCCAALGVLGVVVTRETRRLEEKTLVVYSGLPRQAISGQNIWLQLRLDNLEGDSESSRARFQAVSLRLSGQTFRDFALLSVSPAPTSRSASGRSLVWNELRRDQAIRLLLRPRHGGECRLSLLLLARNFAPFELRRSIKVSRNASSRVPNLH